MVDKGNVVRIQGFGEQTKMLEGFVAQYQK